MSDVTHVINRFNNFDLLRLLAAVLVIFSHSYALSGHAEPKLFFYPSQTYGFLGVRIFFIISGFLITSSWISRQHIGSFLKSRCLRIFPALIILTIITAFMIGPIITTETTAGYFSNIQTLSYLKTSLLFVGNLPLPEVFMHNPITAVNGSLWTLQYEFCLYILIALLGVLGFLKHKISVLIGFVLVLLPYSLYRLGDLNLGTLNGFRFCDLSSYFLIGSLMYLYKDIIPYVLHLAIGCLLIIVFGTLLGGVKTILLPFLLSYLVLFIAFYPKLQFLNRTIQLQTIGDFSYGLYLYAFLVQQLIVFFFDSKPMNPLLNFALALPVTLVCAALSWHLIEKRALVYKN